MLEMIAVLLLFQLVGEALAVAFALPLPGPVIGMALLFLALLLWGELPDALDRVTRGLLENLSLLFVPAGVGVMTHLGLLDRQWLTLAVTGWTMQWLVRRRDRTQGVEPDE
jgi:holin-like protein